MHQLLFDGVICCFAMQASCEDQIRNVQLDTLQLAAICYYNNYISSCLGIDVEYI